MKRLIRCILLLMLAALAVGPASAFSLLGPAKVTANGYSFDYQVQSLAYDLPGDIGTPMTLQEGYRWNIPVITYAYDQSFFNYFGSNGVAAIEKAIAILNDLPPASQITNDGAQLYIRGQPVPFTPRQINYSAQALQLLDVKTTALRFLLEEMGLAEPERWTFALRARVAATAVTNYSVIKLNYDPISLNPTNAVNGAHYTYQIFDPLRGPDRSDAIEFPVDPLELPWQSVAGFFWTDVGAFVDIAGVYYDSLSYDDVGGLRYLFNPNNLAFETLPPGSTFTGGGGGGSSTGTNLLPWTPVFSITNIAAISNILATNIVSGTTNTNTFLQTIALRGGVNKVTFQRVAFDSLIGNTFTPITLRWSDTIVDSSGRTAKVSAQRVVTVPDIVFGVQNLGGAIGAALIRRTSTASWFNNDLLNGTTTLGGPGIIAPPMDILFTDQLQWVLNINPGLLLEPPPNSGFESFTWASFDGTTNPPVIYPAFGGFTVEELQSAILGGN